MGTNEANLNLLNAWGDEAPREALRQVAEVSRKGLSLDLQVAGDGAAFQGVRKEGSPPGILTLSGKLLEEGVIRLRCELLRGPEDLRVSSGTFFRHLACLGEKTRLVPPVEAGAGEASLSVELNIKASPLSLSRASALLEELERLEELARILQEELPVIPDETHLAKLYKELEEILEPVRAWEDPSSGPGTILGEWAVETVDFLLGSSSVALAAPFPVALDFALAVCARLSQHWGRTLGRLLLPAINSQKLVELSLKAPGIVVVPAPRLSLGSSLYELGSDTKNLLASLFHSNRPAIFTGTLDELQAVFHGGQGGSSDPLLPVVRHVPEVSLETLTKFVIQEAGNCCGGLPAAEVEKLFSEALAALQDQSPAEQKRLLPLLARRMVSIRSAGRKVEPSRTASFIAVTSSLSETLGGLSPRPRVERSASVQDRFSQVFTDSGLLPFFQEHLLAQDEALEQLVARLRMECLTRPLHQPLRYCAQGTPGTGKSESAVLMARRLEVPYVNVDCASIPNSYTGMAQLLGSGRGIVGSYQAGRLEMVARHHTGAVVEISDLDHAPADVRSSLADVFLQALETGEAQAASGAMFSCANLILVFTMNLPRGSDEQVRQGIGFNNIPSRREVKKRVVKELKNVLSGAFLSRVGTPILFEPLDGEALAVILERAIVAAVRAAAQRLQCSIREVICEPGLGRLFLSSLEISLTSFGARGLLEHGRSLAAQAFLDLQQRGDPLFGKILRVTARDYGKLVIDTEG
ncbi:MAG: AAA family ATPase [Thermodesulfobacteriota bacterium]